MTLTLELPEPLLQRLQDAARARHSSVEDVALEVLSEKFENDTTQKWSSAEVRDTARRVIAEDRELLRRLAQ